MVTGGKKMDPIVVGNFLLNLLTELLFLNHFLLLVGTTRVKSTQYCAGLNHKVPQHNFLSFLTPAVEPEADTPLSLEKIAY